MPKSKAQTLLQEYRRLQRIYTTFNPGLIRSHAYFNLAYHNLFWQNTCNKYDHRKQWNERHDENGKPI